VANFYQKFAIFAILSYLSTHLYTYNVEILRTYERHKIS